MNDKTNSGPKSPAVDLASYLDPFAFFREAAAILEKQTNSLSEAVTSKQDFARTTQIATQLQLKSKEAVSQHMARQLEFLNMPTRADVTALGERMSEIEDRLIRIERLLKDGPGASRSVNQTAMPPRTKKPRQQEANKETT